MRPSCESLGVKILQLHLYRNSCVYPWREAREIYREVGKIVSEVGFWKECILSESECGRLEEAQELAQSGKCSCSKERVCLLVLCGFQSHVIFQFDEAILELMENFLCNVCRYPEARRRIVIIALSAVH